MPRVELIYDADCPNIRPARRALLEGFREAGLPPTWTEWDRKSSRSPAHVRRYSSPTILVDGRDVTGAEPAEEGFDACRVYGDGRGGLSGVPLVQTIASALRKANRPTSRGAEDEPGRGSASPAKNAR